LSNSIDLFRDKGGYVLTNEFWPVLAGIVLGLLLRHVPLRLRSSIGIGLTLLFGCLATIASGEFRVSGTYYLLDTLRVTVSAVVVLWIVRRKIKI
jgi:hypothetical protein